MKYPNTVLLIGVAATDYIHSIFRSLYGPGYLNADLN